jgi:hypothetical protein
VIRDVFRISTYQSTLIESNRPSTPPSSSQNCTAPHCRPVTLMKGWQRETGVVFPSRGSSLMKSMRATTAAPEQVLQAPALAMIAPVLSAPTLQSLKERALADPDLL